MNITIPAISLRHLTHFTQRWLITQKNYAKEQPFLIADYGEGFFLRIPACTAIDDPEQKAEFYSFPEDLQRLFRFMQPRSPFGWIMLDVDGDPEPGLPTY